MYLTQAIAFELAPSCPHAHAHPFCPASQKRWEILDTSAPMSDDLIVETAVRLMRDFHFRGLFQWHYYNEPLVTVDRMLGLMERIREADGYEGTPAEPRFLLWTNASAEPFRCEKLKGFDQVHVSIYPECEDVLCKLAGLADDTGADPIVHFPHDDGRVSPIPGPLGYCCRMFMEMIFDYYGNAHTCCYDWRGENKMGNLNTSPLPEIVERWREVRLRLLPGHAAAPPPARCRQCQGTHILTRLDRQIQVEAHNAINGFLCDGTPFPTGDP